MKYDKNSHQITSSGTTAHPEQTVPDNNRRKKFKVELSYTQTCSAIVIVEAASLAEAEEMADEIDSGDIENWEPEHGDLHVCSVEAVGEEEVDHD